MTKPRIILDCDPGHDDAIALLLAGHCYDVLGVLLGRCFVLTGGRPGYGVWCGYLGLEPPTDCGSGTKK